MSIYSFITILLLLTCLAAQYEALFESRNPSEVDRIRLHLEDNDRILVPKHASLKIVRQVIPILPSLPGQLFEEDEEPIKPRKKTKYPKLYSHFGRFGSLNNEAAFIEELFTAGRGSTQIIHGDPQFDDVKPVTEHIENDFKYDFRTKTHSI